MEETHRPHVYAAAPAWCSILGADFLQQFNLLIELQRHRLIIVDSRYARHEGNWTINILHVFTIAHDVPTEFRQFLERYREITIPSIMKVDPVAHHIMTTEPLVSEQRLTGDKLQTAKEVFDLMLKQGIVRPLISPLAKLPRLQPLPSCPHRVRSTSSITSLSL